MGQLEDDQTLSNGKKQINGDLSYNNNSRKSVSKSSNANGIHNQMSKPSVSELYANFDKLKKLEDSSPSQAHTLISQMGGFNGLIDYVESDNDDYSAMLKRVEQHIENGTKCIELITKYANDVLDDEKSDE